MLRGRKIKNNRRKYGHYCILHSDKNLYFYLKNTILGIDIPLNEWYYNINKGNRKKG